MNEIAVRDEYPAATLATLPAAIRATLPASAARPPLPTCHRCGTTATVQWHRRATDAEVEQHWTAQEQNIRSIPDLFGHGNATYTADRTQDVTRAVHGCDEHVVDDTVTVHAEDCGGHGACQCEGTTADG